MNHSSHSTTDAPPAPVGVAPLTQVGKKSGALYQRRPDVEVEIAEHLAKLPASWVQKALNSETLVYLARWLRRTNDLDLIGAVVAELGRRITGIARNYASGLSKSEALDYAADVAAQVNCLIFATTPSRRSDFLEVAFHNVVKPLAINERAKIRRRKRRILVETSLASAGDSEEDGLSIVSSCADEKPNPEERALEMERHKLNPDRVRKALAAVKKQEHREAFILHVLKGWPIESVDSQTPTLSSHFGRTPRQIQTWLTTARQQMRTALGEEI